MTRRTQVVIAAFFVAVIGAPVVALALGMRPELPDNRSPADLPELSGSAVVDESTYAGITAYLTDRLPLRDRAIRLEAELDEAITLSDPVQVGVPRGRGGWLFHHDTLVGECPEDGDPDEFVDLVDQVSAGASGAGLDVLVVVTPDKASLYPQFLPVEGVAGMLDLDMPAEPACGALWRNAVVEAAQDRPVLLALVEPLAEVSDDVDDPTYWPRDTHWTPRGALVQTRELLDSLAPGVWDPSDVRATGDLRREGDLVRLRGLSGDDVVPGYEVVRPGVSVQVTRGGDAVAEDTLRISRATSTAGAPLVPGTTLLIGDSFADQSLFLLEPYFEELVFLDWLYLLFYDIEEIAAETPDAIVVAHVQRNLLEGAYEVSLGEMLDYIATR